MGDYWLISKEDAGIIRQGLLAFTHRKNDFNCPDDYPELGECSGCEGNKLRELALYRLDTGLHLTDVIPADMLEEA